MNIGTKAGNSLIFYTGQNYAGNALDVLHGETGVLAAGNDSWNYQSVAMSAMHAFCWSEVNVADATRNNQNHTESLITANIPNLTALYSTTAFPLFYLGIDPAIATPVWLDMLGVTGDTDAVAATSLVAGSSTSITTLSRPGLEGVAGFVGLTAGSSVVASCSYGAYDSTTGQVSWTGLNAGTLVLEYNGGAVILLSASGFPEGWHFAAPAMQADGSWTIAISGSDASSESIVSVTSDKASIINNGTDSATITATVQDGAGTPVSGVSVYWSTTAGSLSASSSVTDRTGQATVILSDTGDTGAAAVTASLDNGSQKSVTVSLTDSTAGATIVSLTSDKSVLYINGESANLTAIVEDALRHSLEGVTVSWSVVNGKLNTTRSVTDASGAAVASVTATGLGSVIVTASLANSDAKSIPLQAIEPVSVFPAFTALNVKEGTRAGTIGFELVAHSMPGGQAYVFRFNTTPLSGVTPGNPDTTLSLTDTTHVFLSNTACAVTSTYIQQNITTYLNNAPADDTTATIHIVVDNLRLVTSTWEGGIMTVQYSVGGGSYKTAPAIYIPALA